MELLATFTEHAVAPCLRVGPPAFWRHRHTGGPAACRLGKHSHADQARSGGERPAASAAPRHTPTQRTRVGCIARGVAATAICGADRLDDREREGSAGGARVRRFALGRSNDARSTARPCRAWRASAIVHRPQRDRSSGRLGASGRITVPSRSRRSTAPRYATW